MTPAFQIPEFPASFNMASYFLDARIAQGQGERVAVRYRGGRLTYAEILQASNRVANVLHNLEVEPENRVLVVLPDRPEFVSSFFGILKTGAVVTMANPLLPAEDYTYLLDYTRAKVVITHKDVLPRIAEPIAQCKWIRSALVVDSTPDELSELGGPHGRFQCFDTLTRESRTQFNTFAAHRDDIAMWLFTSGTTGKSKGAMHRHADFAFNTECYAKGVLGYNENDVTLAVSKLFFGYATGTNLMFPFSVGGSTALFEERSTPEQVHSMIAQYRPTILAAVPTTLNGMLQVPTKEQSDLSCLRFVVSAGEALPEELARRFRDAYGVEILDGIGSAEMFHIYATNFPGRSRPGSLGQVVPGYKIEIRDDNGAPVPTGEIGTMWVTGETAASGYWQDRAKSVATFQGNSCRTGDRFRQDADGFLYLAGRDDDLLKVGGIWVSPLEVENCLMSAPHVREACVVGYEEDGLTKPLAFIVLAEGQTHASAEEVIRAHCRQHLVAYKVPRRFEFVDALPRNDRGKIARKDLRDRTTPQRATPGQGN